MMMEGTICWGNDDDLRWLRRNGIKVGKEEESSGGWFHCSMTREVFDKKLEPRWGQFFWILKEKEESSEQREEAT